MDEPAREQSPIDLTNTHPRRSARGRADRVGATVFGPVDRSPQREGLSGPKGEGVPLIRRNVEPDGDGVVTQGFDVGNGQAVEVAVARRTGDRNGGGLDG